MNAAASAGFTVELTGDLEESGGRAEFKLQQVSVAATKKEAKGCMCHSSLHLPHGSSQGNLLVHTVAAEAVPCQVFGMPQQCAAFHSPRPLCLQLLQLNVEQPAGGTQETVHAAAGC